MLQRSMGEDIELAVRAASNLGAVFVDPSQVEQVLWDCLAPLRPKMKVLFMSGYTDDAIIHRGVLSANVCVVQKPLMPGALLVKVREGLGQHGRLSQPQGATQKRQLIMKMIFNIILLCYEARDPCRTQ
jgi:hypothetical protein